MSVDVDANRVVQQYLSYKMFIETSVLNSHELLCLQYMIKITSEGFVNECADLGEVTPEYMSAYCAMILTQSGVVEAINALRE